MSHNGRNCRVLLDAPPFSDTVPGTDGRNPWEEPPGWDCRWVTCAEAGNPPFVTAYRITFDAAQEATVRVHVSGDERYALYLNGSFVGRGSERGDKNRWYYETYDLALAAGSHTLVAVVWSLGRMAHWAQVAISPGFLLAPQDAEWQKRIGTGRAEWEAKIVSGVVFVDPSEQARQGMGTGASFIFDGREYTWGVEAGEGTGWNPAAIGEAGNNGFLLYTFKNAHRLHYATLPPMIETPYKDAKVRHVSTVADAERKVRDADDIPEEHLDWNRWLAGTAMTLPPHTSRRIIVDFQNYLCAYLRLETSGGAGSRIQIHWAEALYSEDNVRSDKGRRDVIAEKYFYGAGDSFLMDGGMGRVYEPYWWRAGRFAEIRIETGDAPLTLDSLSFRETRYPLESESQADCDDREFNPLFEICLRSLQMCAHETYMDCPYYEQLMYVGDTRLQMLLTYALTTDDRLPRKALELFNLSRVNVSGWTTASAPSGAGQLLPSFSLWWVAMLYDYALWRGDLPFVRTLLPGARTILEQMIARRNANGLIVAPQGWNYMDWAANLNGADAACGAGSITAALHWQTVLVLTLLAKLETWVEEPELAGRADRLARELAEAGSAFWQAERGLFSNDLRGTSFSEHTQCLALLSGMATEEQQNTLAQTLFSDPALTRTSIYFSHYLFAAYQKLGRVDVLLKRLTPWLSLAKNGYVTTPESFGLTRSDCHAWGAHPLFHYYTAVLGIQPVAPEFAAVVIKPHLGRLGRAGGNLVHPRGEISVAFRQTEGLLQGQITLPSGIGGSLIANGTSLLLPTDGTRFTF